MTSGTRNPSNYVNFQYDLGGLLPRGWYMYKSWNGGDDPLKKRVNSYTLSLAQNSAPLAYVRNKIPGSPMQTCSLAQFQGSYTSGVTQYPSEIDVWVKLDTLIRQHSFNAAVFAAEGRESVQTILGTVRALVRSTGHLRNRRIGPAINALLSRARERKIRVPKSGRPYTVYRRTGSLSATWLSLQYGWKPLLNDCFEAANYLFSLTNKQQFKSFRASKTWKDPIAAPPPYAGPGSWFKHHCRYTIHVNVLEGFTPWASLGLMDPDIVLWEKIPYSFVVDWFIPIGNYLQARALFRNCTFTSYRTTSERYEGAFYGLSHPSYWYIGGDGPRNVLNLGITRTSEVPVTGWWTAGNVVPFPGFKRFVDAATPTHLANGLALLRANMRGWN